MATFALRSTSSTGTMMTKPYAGGGNYVDRMSTYCGDCVHEPRSCPVTALYWDFIARHAGSFAHNRRMRGPLRSLAGMNPARLADLRERAAAWSAAL